MKQMQQLKQKKEKWGYYVRARFEIQVIKNNLDTKVLLLNLRVYPFNAHLRQ